MVDSPILYTGSYTTMGIIRSTSEYFDIEAKGKLNLIVARRVWRKIQMKYVTDMQLSRLILKYRCQADQISMWLFKINYTAIISADYW